MENTETLTPEAAQAEISRLPLDESMMAALKDPAHPGHQAAALHRRALYAVAYPGDTEGERAARDGKTAQSSRDAPAQAEPDDLFDAPPSPQDYRFDATPPALGHDTELEQKARQWFHTADAPGWLARNIVNEWNRLAAAQPTPEAVTQQAAATEKILREAWGDDYEGKVAKARALIDGLGNDDAVELLDRSGLANSEYFIRQLVALAEHRAAR
jgi:hypothetical protein